MEKWKPKDIIAGICIIGCLALKFNGLDGVISWTMLAVAATYFGFEIPSVLKLGKKSTTTTQEVSSSDTAASK